MVKDRERDPISLLDSVSESIVNMKQEIIRFTLLSQANASNRLFW